MSQITLEQKPLEEIEHKPSRWISLVEQSMWVALLGSLGLNEFLDSLKSCATQCAKFRCSEYPTHSKKVRYLFCGKRGLCPRCSMIYAYKKSEIMYQWIKVNIADKLPSYFDLKMNHIVLTLPQELHSDIDSRIFTKMVKKFMSKIGAQAYGYSDQERHSNNPLGGRYVHAHILSLNIKMGEKGLIKNEYYFDPDTLRSIWKEIIQKSTGCHIEGPVDVFTEYVSVLKQKSDTLRLLAYLYKYPIVDLFDKQIRGNPANYLDILHFNTSPDSIASELRSMAKTKPRLVWVGLLAPSKRKLLMSLIHSYSWQDMRTVKKSLFIRSNTCLDCGALLESTPYEIVPYDGDNEPHSGS